MGHGSHNSAIEKISKTNHPDVPYLDAELAVASASEKNKALALLNDLMQTAVDTLHHHNPELYDD